MKKMLIIMIVLFNYVLTQCTELDNSTCNSNPTCEWVEIIEDRECDINWDNDTCSYQPGCTAYCSGTLWVYGAFSYCIDGDWTCEGQYQIDIGYCQESEVYGDLNNDFDVNIFDAVILVNYILDDEYHIEADLNDDSMINILDIMTIIEIILNPMEIQYASSIQLEIDRDVRFSSNGKVGGIQMTLSHNEDFSINLTDEAMISEYSTIDNVTELIIVLPENDYLFTPTGNFKIQEIIAVNLENEIDITINEIPKNYSVSNAFPNPFNPTTTININLPKKDFVNIKIYNIHGQLVEIVENRLYSSGQHTITWNAGNISSGAYFINSQIGNFSNTQKVMLVK